MSYTIKNVALDRRYEGVRRRASKLVTEPMIAGRRLRVRRSLTITDKEFKAAQPRIEELMRMGVVELIDGPYPYGSSEQAAPKETPKQEEPKAPAPDPSSFEENTPVEVPTEKSESLAPTHVEPEKAESAESPQQEFTTKTQSSGGKPHKGKGRKK